jgi:hypothetical protein
MMPLVMTLAQITPALITPALTTLALITLALMTLALMTLARIKPALIKPILSVSPRALRSALRKAGHSSPLYGSASIFAWRRRATVRIPPCR